MSNLLMVSSNDEKKKKRNSVDLMIDLDVVILRRLGLASFLYMIIFAGLEYTITFLVYNRFNWDRSNYSLI